MGFWTPESAVKVPDSSFGGHNGTESPKADIHDYDK
jgi:hypothetical protein